MESIIAELLKQLLSKEPDKMLSGNILRFALGAAAVLYATAALIKAIAPGGLF